MSEKKQSCFLEITRDMVDENENYLKDIFNSEKKLIKAYSEVISRTSSNMLCSDYFNMFNDAFNFQKEFYNYIIQKEWYSLETLKKLRLSFK
ncbi:MAG: spore coat protein [Bacilli bacterium]